MSELAKATDLHDLVTPQSHYARLFGFGAAKPKTAESAPESIHHESAKKPLRRVQEAPKKGRSPTARDPCPFRKLYPAVLVVQSSQDRNGEDGARTLDCSMQGRIFL